MFRTLTDFGLRRNRSATCQPDHIMWTCLYTDSASGTELGLEVDYHRFPVLHLIDLLVRRRIYGEEFKRINRACDHTIIAAGTPLHVDMQCKCHTFITHQL
jgi:hypothetical protein